MTRQKLGDSAVASGRLEQSRKVDPRQNKVELRARVASGQHLEDASSLSGEPSTDAGQGLGSRESDSAVPRDRGGGGVERRGLALGLGAAARKDTAAAAAVAATSFSRTPRALSDGEAGEVDRLLDLVLDVGRGDDLFFFFFF